MNFLVQRNRLYSLTGVGFGVGVSLCEAELKQAQTTSKFPFSQPPSAMGQIMDMDNRKTVEGRWDIQAMWKGNSTLLSQLPCFGCAHL